MKNIRRTLILLLSAVAIFSLAPTSLMADKPDSPPGKPEIVPPESPPGNPEIVLPKSPPGQDICVRHNGIKYCEVTSATERIWLDRNLGAARVCRAFDDDACYGDYYQWGRNTDGHEDYLSGETTDEATNVENVGHGMFIITVYMDDWAVGSADGDGSIRSANWLKTDGSSVCPVGYRVPTITELETESQSWGSGAEGAFESALKLPSAGYRSSDDGDMSKQGSVGYVWSSIGDGHMAFLLILNSSLSQWMDFTPKGMSVRCIKD